MNRYPLPAIILVIAAAVLLALFIWTLVFADNGRLSPPEWPTPSGVPTPPAVIGYPGPAPTADPYPAPYPGPAVYLPVQLESYP